MNNNEEFNYFNRLNDANTLINSGIYIIIYSIENNHLIRKEFRINKKINMIDINILNIDNNFEEINKKITIAEASLLLFKNILLCYDDIDFDIILKNNINSHSNDSIGLKIPPISIELDNINKNNIEKYLNNIKEKRKKDGYIKYIKHIDYILYKGINTIINESLIENDIYQQKTLISSGINKEYFSNIRFIWNIYKETIQNNIIWMDNVLNNYPNNNDILITMIEASIVSEKLSSLKFLENNKYLNKLEIKDWNKILNYPSKCYKLYKVIKNNIDLKQKLRILYLQKKIAVTNLYNHKDLIEKSWELYYNFYNTINGINLLSEIDFLSTNIINHIIVDDSVSLCNKINKFKIYRSLNNYTNIYRSYEIFDECDKYNIQIIEDDPDWNTKHRIFNSESHYKMNLNSELNSLFSNNKEEFRLYVYTNKKTYTDNDGFEHPILIMYINNVKKYFELEKNKIKLIGELNEKQIEFKLYKKNYNNLIELDLDNYDNKNNYFKLLKK